MSRRPALCRVATFLALVAWLGLAQTGSAQTLVESSAEARFHLDLQVPAAALASFLPAGWSPNISTRGPVEDANLRAIFIERTTINDPEGAPVGDGSNLLVYLTVPTTNPEGDRAQLVIGDITHDAADAPGPLGVYSQATTGTLLRTTNSGPGPIVETQDWAFEASSG